ncbi:hypothetical protein T484DRAFT_1765015, partial [Baffinella frigidus]
QTLALEPNLHLPIADSRFFDYCQWGFERTPIGLLTPPIQFYKIENAGAIPFEYHLEMDEVDELNRANHDFDVVTLLDPINGHLDPGDVLYLRWVFNPLQPILHEWNVEFQVVGGPTKRVTFRAEGYHPDPHSAPETTVWPLPLHQVMPLPNQPVMPLPNQPVLMSSERFCFGDVPMGASIDRLCVLNNYDEDEAMTSAFDLSLCVLNNYDEDETMTFAFDFSSHLASSVLTISPRMGEIPPQSHAVVRVTLRSMMAAVFDFDVPCHILVKRPPEEENEDLGDDNAERTPASTSSRPQTGQTAVSVNLQP